MTPSVNESILHKYFGWASGTKPGNTGYSFVIPLVFTCLFFLSCSGQSIDRKALVSRHSVEITGADSLNSLTVGNGSFAFTADITGMQSFPCQYEKGIPLGTQSDWGWNSFPNKGNYTLSD
ncbi:MAG TPA: hypothetical protein PLK12_17750, partial [Prolixibacteraceae bacterium]|nr:hypothetical protein [Prolixibacteraceae bacterium]